MVEEGREVGGREEEEEAMMRVRAEMGDGDGRQEYWSGVCPDSKVHSSTALLGLVVRCWLLLCSAAQSRLLSLAVCAAQWRKEGEDRRE